MEQNTTLFLKLKISLGEPNFNQLKTSEQCDCTTEEIYKIIPAVLPDIKQRLESMYSPEANTFECYHIQLYLKIICGMFL